MREGEPEWDWNNGIFKPPVHPPVDYRRISEAELRTLRERYVQLGWADRQRMIEEELCYRQQQETPSPFSRTWLTQALERCLEYELAWLWREIDRIRKEKKESTPKITITNLVESCNEETQIRKEINQWMQQFEH